MPFGYLFALLLVFAATLAALGSARQPRRLGHLVYLFSVVVNEVPHVAVAWLALTTAIALAQQDLTGTAGAILLGLAALTTIGLMVVGRRTLSAPGAVQAGLLASGITLPRAGSRGWLRAHLSPIPFRPRSVERIGGLAYGAHRRQRLDVYRRRGETGAGPVLVYLHGGGYFSGGRHREARALLHRLAAQGWLCVSASYRLRPRADFPEHLYDARTALAWAHENAPAFGGDPGTLVMAGSSAGAHLASLCALTEPLDAGSTSAGHAARTRVDAVICLYGYFGRYYGRDVDECPISNPTAADARSAPPFLVVHGSRDTYVPVAGARAFVAHLQDQSGRPVVYVELPDAQHGFDLLRSWRFENVLGAVDAFLTATVIANRSSADGQIEPRR